GYPAGKASRTRKRVRTCAEIAFLWLFLSLARLASGTAFRACDSNLSQVLLDPRTGYTGPANYVVLKESYSYMLESAISTNKFLQKNIFTHFFFPDSHNRRGESGLGGGGGMAEMFQMWMSCESLLTGGRNYIVKTGLPGTRELPP
ncbi:MAG TPA: hypothetical protein DCZ04_11745, partial [Syntrophorhabdus aromaticivorans]|nr:hypothetical protein [Syntrophorhabdus aromaticivorans]